MQGSIDWNVLLPAVQNKRCVLFLGPDAYPFSATETVEQALWAATTSDPALVRKFYPDDGLVLFQKKSNRGKFIEFVQQFFNDPEKDWALTRLQLHKLVHLPFLAIVNFTFDDLLPKTYHEAGLECQAVHYIFRPSLTEKPITELPLDGRTPLVLNLLGSMHSSDNLVITHTDLFDFLKTLFEDKDQWLKELLHEADCFLFIGVPFEKWYLQLLLQKLSKYAKSHEDAERYALPDDKEVRMVDLYNHELKIQFVEEGQQNVVERLYQFCEEKNILNHPQTPLAFFPDPGRQNIYRRLLRGELEQALAEFLAFAQAQTPPNAELNEALTLASAQFRTLQQAKDTMTPRDYLLERNKLVKGLLYCLNLA